jgi:putative phosphoesterase
MSDTHCNQHHLRKVCLQGEYDFIFHLGDDFADLNDNDDLLEGKILVRVPGNANSVLPSEQNPLKQYITIEGWHFLLVHRQQDFASSDIADVVCFGHTHQPDFTYHNNIPFLNPGHLKASMDRGFAASYLIMEVAPEILRCTWKSLDGKILTEQLFFKP